MSGRYPANSPSPRTKSQSYPTPDSSEYIFSELVQTTRESREPQPAYGDACSYEGFTDATLQKVEPTEMEGWHKRIWAKLNTASSQDAYNALIKLTGESNAHKIYVRSSLVNRLDYTPQAKLTADSVDGSAMLTHEEAKPAEEPFTQYVRVTRVYENFGSRADQDTWNAELSYPYLSTAHPRIKRKYRFASTFNIAGTFTIGTTTDTVFTSAKLVSMKTVDPDFPTVTIICEFEDTPDAASLQNGFGYSVEYDNDNTNFPIVT